VIKNAKFCIVHKYREKYSIQTTCSILKCSKSGYYAWLKRQDRKDNDDVIADLIIDCQKETRNTYGYRRVKNWLLRETGLIINHKTVLRIMTKYGLLSEIRRRRKYKSHLEKAYKANNIIAGDFNADSKNSKWVTDISYIHTQAGIYYLSAIKDLYDGFIISHKLGKRNDMGLVADTLRIAKHRLPNGVCLHSDQGTQYTSSAYNDLTKEFGITPSMSRAGTPLDNAPIESFFGTLKCECIYRSKPKDFEHAATLIDDYIHFYNYIRLQSKSKMTPYEKRCLNQAS
jgi:putative transposase